MDIGSQLLVLTAHDDLGEQHSILVTLPASLLLAPKLSAFDKMAQESYRLVYDPMTSTPPPPPARPFNLVEWGKKTAGGLMDQDRLYLAKLYGQAESVFEYGLGESTYIADHVGVRRYAGIDSDPVWVGLARANVSSHFRFYLADIGETKRWGFPEDNLTKSVFQYQMGPLVSEPEAFDVYMVDGRWRFACMMAAFLHASAHGAPHTKTTVLLHDCMANPDEHIGAVESGAPRKHYRMHYHDADHLLRLEHSGGVLCAYHRLETTTDEQLLDMWYKHRLKMG